jgi:signal transduction histidine kinase
MMRMRLLDQLESANIELEWAVTELPEIKNMGPRHSLHIMRIVQEAITNSIKHSSSTTMTLATGIIDNEKVYIDIIDYGQSQSNNNTPSSTSRGINNMRYRAEQLGGELQIKHTETGTSVRLLLNI